MQESDIFCVARKLEGPAREAYLLEACGNNAELRSDVDALLEVHRRQQGSTLHLNSVLQDTQPLKLQSLFADRYRLQELLGHGGMGLVYLAEQLEPIQRQCAIKIIKTTQATKSMQVRFEQERQALALMDHHHIARVYDAGVTRIAHAYGTNEQPVETPYLVMEYIRGIPITKYCDENKLDVHQRVGLFIPVCQAIQHAHQKGIIHRDLKPNNILVVEQDGKPIAKVIDFGIAKVLEHKLTAESIETEVGSIIGTLEYMSPEQARLKNHDVDTRTDIYSLGVILYELISGTPPFSKDDFRQYDLNHMLAMIQETEPVKPSIRFSESSTTHSTLRLSSWRKARQHIQGDLDWIVMKCLEKDRNRRYGAAGELGIELERYLANEPVQAGAPGWTYRWRKLLRKHRLLASAAALVLLSLLAGTVVASIGLLQARQAEGLARQHADQLDKARLKEIDLRHDVEMERDRAEEEKRVAEAISTFLRSKLLAQGDYNAQVNHFLARGEALEGISPDPPVSLLLQRADQELTPEAIDRNFPGQPLVQLALLRTVGNTYSNIGQLAPALSRLRQAEEIAQRVYGPHHVNTLEIQRFLCHTLTRAGQLDSAKKLCLELISNYRQHLPLQRKEKTLVLCDLSFILCKQGEFAQALVTGKEALEEKKTIYTDSASRQASEMAYAILLVNAMQWKEAFAILDPLQHQLESQLGMDHFYTHYATNAFAVCCAELGRASTAVSLLTTLRQRQEQRLGKLHSRTLKTQYNLAIAHHHLKQYQVAVSLLTDLLHHNSNHGRDAEVDTAQIKSDLGISYVCMGQLDKGLPLLHEGVKEFTEQYGAHHPKVTSAQHNLAFAYNSQKRWMDAIALLETVVKARIDLLGKHHINTQRSEASLAANYVEVSRYQDALDLLHGIYKQRSMELGTDHLDTVDITYRMACCLRGMRRFQEAHPLLEHAWKLYSDKVSTHDRTSLRMKSSLAANHFSQKRHQLALTMFQEILAVREKNGLDHLETVETRSNIGACLQDLHRHAEALPHFQRVYEDYLKHYGDNHHDSQQAAYAIAQCMTKTGQSREAVPRFLDVLQWRERKLGKHHIDTVKTITSLGHTHWILKQFDLAVKFYGQAVERYRAMGPAYRSNELLALENLGINLAEQGKYVEAYVPLKKACGNNSSASDSARTVFLESMLATKRFDEAQAEYEARRRRLLQQSPQDHKAIVQTHFLMSNAFIKHQAYELACRSLKDTLDCHSQAKAVGVSALSELAHIRVLALQGRALFKLQKLDDAERIMLQAQQMLPKDNRKFNSALAYRWIIEQYEDLESLHLSMKQPDKASKWRKQRDAFIAKNAAGVKAAQ